MIGGGVNCELKNANNDFYILQRFCAGSFYAGIYLVSLVYRKLCDVLSVHGQLYLLYCCEYNNASY